MTSAVDTQIELLELARLDGQRGDAMLAASHARRALSIGGLSRLTRRLRALARDENEGARFRARFAILAVQIESILARRKAARESRRKPQQTRQTALRRHKLPAPYSEPGRCPECGTEPPMARNGKTRVYCSDRCKSSAWTRRNRPAEYLRRRSRAGNVVAVIQRGYDHAAGGPIMEGVNHG